MSVDSMTEFLVPFCATAPERHLAHDGLLFPLCGRCSGIYLGFFLAALFFHASFIHRAAPSRRGLRIAAAVMVIVLPLEVLFEVSQLIAGSNRLRYLTGLFFGTGLFALLFSPSPSRLLLPDRVAAPLVAGVTLLIISPLAGIAPLLPGLAGLSIVALAASYLFINARFIGGLLSVRGGRRPSRAAGAMDGTDWRRGLSLLGLALLLLFVEYLLLALAKWRLALDAVAR